MAHVAVLVVGGGGPGGNGIGGGASSGGGAGGYQYNPSFEVLFQAYLVTVGDGGNPSNNGQDSIFSTITAIGGGYGVIGYGNNGKNGGSGSGGGGYVGESNLGGTGSQGHDGGVGCAGANFCAGGGGGAGTKGGDATNTNAGNGGDGVLNPITGSGYICAGGGGGAWVLAGNVAGTGGLGGGGAGGYGGNPNGVAGAPDTGSGGGGGDSEFGSLGGKGGSGLVQIKYLTSDFGDCTGGTKTVDGLYTIHTFKLADSGTYMTFVLGNSAPDVPTNVTPSDGVKGQSGNPILVGNAFSDPEDDAQYSSQWQVATDSEFNSVVWDSGEDTDHFITTIVDISHGTFAGVLSGQTKLAENTIYYWRVRYKDIGSNTFSSYSTGTSFKTLGPSTNYLKSRFRERINLKGYSL